MTNDYISPCSFAMNQNFRSVHGPEHGLKFPRMATPKDVISFRKFCDYHIHFLKIDFFLYTVSIRYPPPKSRTGELTFVELTFLAIPVRGSVSFGATSILGLWAAEILY